MERGTMNILVGMALVVGVGVAVVALVGVLMCLCFPGLDPPSRAATCRHDRREPHRQTCHCCGVQDHIDFRVSDGCWRRVVPARFQTVHICLRCFDAFAAENHEPYAHDLERVDFVGDRGIFEFRPFSALDSDEWVRADKP
jgi:hypothetical protein